MHRIVADAYGPPQVLRMERAAAARPGPGQALVRVAYAGVNFIDIYQRTGAYQVDFPWYPGIEGAGVVRRVGPGVTEVAEGDRVAWLSGAGSYATECVVPAQRLVAVPDGVDLAEAAAALVQGMTAHWLAGDVVALRSGQTCLVHAAAGGVGGLLCQLARARGATVIATVSTSDKVVMATAAGACHVIDRGVHRFPQRVAELTAGAGVHVVYDGIGRDTFIDGLSCLQPRGTFVLYGQSSGPVGPVDPALLGAHGSLFLTRASLSHYDTTRDQLVTRAGAVLDLIGSGRLRVRVHAALPLEQAAAAHEALGSGQVSGKLLLNCG